VVDVCALAYGQRTGKDRERGLVTVRQRILFRFDLILAMLARSGWYPAIAEATQRMVDALSARWTDVPGMPVYPAFRTPHATSS